MFDDFTGAVRQSDLPVTHKQTASVAGCHISAIADSPSSNNRNFHAVSVNAASTGSVSINMLLALEGAAIAAAIARRERLQYWQDLVSDAAYDHELGNLPHRELGEAVVAAFLANGVLDLDR
jgi:hypothetical protein